jgi:hypothetical protein
LWCTQWSDEYDDCQVSGVDKTLCLPTNTSTVWEILREAGIGRAPDRAAATWSQFPPWQAEALLGADFIETVTLTGARHCVLAVVGHPGRRVQVIIPDPSDHSRLPDHRLKLHLFRQSPGPCGKGSSESVAV